MEDDTFFDGDCTTAGFHWTNERLNLLITLYAEETLLWDTTSSEYHNREERNNANARIAEAVGCDAEEVVRKLRHLRTYYARELTKVKKSLSDPSKKPRKSGWMWYSKLDEFLHNHMTQMPPRISNAVSQSRSSPRLIKAEVDSPLAAATVAESSESSDEVPQFKKRPSSSTRYRSSKRYRRQSRDSDDESDDDPDAVFGRHVANELKLITNLRSKQFAKLQIHSILFNAQFGLTNIPNDVINALTGSLTKSQKC